MLTTKIIIHAGAGNVKKSIVFKIRGLRALQDSIELTNADKRILLR